MLSIFLFDKNRKTCWPDRRHGYVKIHFYQEILLNCIIELAGIQVVPEAHLPIGIETDSELSSESQVGQLHGINLALMTNGMILLNL